MFRKLISIWLPVLLWSVIDHSPSLLTEGAALGTALVPPAEKTAVRAGKLLSGTVNKKLMTNVEFTTILFFFLSCSEVSHE